MFWRNLYKTRLLALVVFIGMLAGSSLAQDLVSASATFNPTDDAYVQSSSPTSNFGAQTFLRLRKLSSETSNSYLKFNVTGLSGAIHSAKLRLYVSNDGPDGGSVYSVSNNYQGTTTPWTQTGLNWNNAPAISGTALSSAGAVVVGQWVELNVTSAITGNGIYSFGLKNNVADPVIYGSNEAANKPELVIVTSGGQTQPSLSINDVTVYEGDAGTATAQFIVSLSAPSSQTITVNVTTENNTATAGIDYQVIFSPLQLIFAPMTTTKTFAVVVYGDLLDEPNENFFVNLSNPSNATIADGLGIGTIMDDDATGGTTIVLNPTNDAYVQSSNPTTNYGASSRLRVTNSTIETSISYLKFNVTGLSGAIQSAKLRLYVTNAGNAGDVYSASNNYLGTPSAWNETGLIWNNAPAISGTALGSPPVVTAEQWVQVTVTPAITGNGIYSFALKNYSSNATTFGSKESSKKPELVIVTSGGQTQPSLSINDVSVTEGNSGTVNANFTVSLSAPTNQTVTLKVDTAGGTASTGFDRDYQGISTTLTFAPMTTTIPFTIVVNGDVLDEPNETFFVNLWGATNATIADGQGIGTIVDDDATGYGSIVVFRPSEDSYVQASDPTANFATRTFFRQRQSGAENIYSFLKFAVSGLNGAVLSAKLRLYVTNESTNGGSVHSVSNNYKGTSALWVQNGLNWNNAPAISGTVLSSQGAVSLNTWVEFDVTAAIAGNGVYSFGMKNGASDFVDYGSKESTHEPELVIQTSGSSLASINTELSAEEETLPEEFSLSPNYPNPFNAGTTIAYALPQEGNVRLMIYNMLGQMVRKLIDENQAAGHKRILWDSADERGLRVSSGVYLYRVEFGQQRLVGKMILQQ